MACYPKYCLNLYYDGEEGSGTEFSDLLLSTAVDLKSHMHCACWTYWTVEHSLVREKDINNILGDSRRTKISLDEQVFGNMRFSTDNNLHRLGNYHYHLE